MNLDTIIRSALDGQAILFAGSGFNYQAKNIGGNSFITGDKLRDKLATECGYTSSTLDLSRIAGIYKKKFSASRLIHLLREEFTVAEIKPHHETVLSVPWRRVYTTNYDRVIEMASDANGFPMTSVTMSDEIHQREKDYVCVHVNGFIDRLNSRTLETEFKLTDRSYNAETLVGKPYFELMKSDFQTSRCIVIIGFSMNFDLDITRLLALPHIKNKTVFIVSSEIGDDEYDSLSEYAACEKIGIQGFAAQVDIVKKGHKTLDLPVYYRNFTHEYHETWFSGNMSHMELANFYCAGVEKEYVYSQDRTGNYRYLVARDMLFDLMRQIYEEKFFFVVSNLGNGKSIFLHMLRRELAGYDIHVFTYQRGGSDWEQDVENIGKTKGYKVVIIDSYISALDILTAFQRFGIQNTTFILADRTSIHLKAYHKLRKIIPLDHKRQRFICLDKLSESETEAVASIFVREGLLSRKYKTSRIEDISAYLVDTCKSEFVNILLDSFNSSDIKKRILDLYIHRRQDVSENIYNMCIFALVRTLLNVNLSEFDIFDLFDVDYVELRSYDLDFVNEVFEIDNNAVMAKSSIVARELLVNVIEFQSIIDVMVFVFHKANRRYKSSHTMEEMLKNLLSHSNFLMYHDRPDCFDGIVRYYDEIRNDDFCVDNLFFWEQFACSYIDIRQFSAAKRCIETAYTIAKGRRGFVPYQIDSVFGRCVMEEVLDVGFDGSSPDIVISALQQCHRTLMEHYTEDGNNVYYTFRIGGRYADFLLKFISIFDRRQINIYIQCSVEMLNKMNAYLRKGADVYTDSILIWKTALEQSTEKAKLCLRKIV